MATTATSPLLPDHAIVQRIFDHIDHGTTDLGPGRARVPVEHYRSAERLQAELDVLRRTATPFCPSAALAEPGAYVAREAAGTPLVVVRGRDGVARGFRNACRHRGTQLASGAGCAKAFVCAYHGWTYGLDGHLQHVPHEHGFPGLDTSRLGLVPVEVVERAGLVWVTQRSGAAGAATLDGLPELIPAGHRLVGSSQQDIPVNWKIMMDGFLEGYHIRFTHRETFYPVQYDNLNVIETFGRHQRVTYPYRSIEKLRALPPDERRVDGRVLTYVYHLFPNVILATFPEQLRLVAVEPLRTDLSRLFSYTTTSRPPADERGSAEIARATGFANAGGLEDAAVALGIQQGLASDANEFFELGRFEAAVATFHRSLDQAIAEVHA